MVLILEIVKSGSGHLGILNQRATRQTGLLIEVIEIGNFRCPITNARSLSVASFEREFGDAAFVEVAEVERDHLVELLFRRAGERHS